VLSGTQIDRDTWEGISVAMQFYLIREGLTDPSRSVDPYHMPLTPEGLAQVQHVARCARHWGLQMLCASTFRAALDTADVLEEHGRVPVRWDLTELEDLVLDDLSYDPHASHLVSTWTPEQLETGLIALWTRLMPAYTRIQIYAEAHGIDVVGIVSSERVLNLLLDRLLDGDWRMSRLVRFSFDRAPACRVTLQDGAPVTIEWLACGDSETDREVE